MLMKNFERKKEIEQSEEIYFGGAIGLNDT
jgi:hypothetical protein